MFLWTMRGVCLELTHNYGTEEDPEYKVQSTEVGIAVFYKQLSALCTLLGTIGYLQLASGAVAT